MLEMVKGLAAPLGEKNNNKIEFEFPDNVGIVNSDETRLRQCIINLISNACNHKQWVGYPSCRNINR